MSENHFLIQIFNEKNFSKEELERILAQYHPIEFAKNDYLIPLGSVANYYYFIEEGYARSFAIDLEGNDITTKFLAPKIS
jgi:CRP-like cAMP-binding protein